MGVLITVATDGQLVLCRDMLQNFGIQAGDLLEVDKLANGQLMIQAAKQKMSWEQLQGMFADKVQGQCLTIADMDNLIADAIVEHVCR
ncbi:MAG: hypothetical protein E6Q25_07280 [Acinetobacter sp.]|jgi:antitoxin component of MazEF toxin-antitoxin module|nr:MAG: hypothetical protein E6Q25_07280 [Acinetobacter sp.]